MCHRGQFVDHVCNEPTMDHFLYRRVASFFSLRCVISSLISYNKLVPGEALHNSIMCKPARRIRRCRTLEVIRSTCVGINFLTSRCPPSIRTPPVFKTNPNGSVCLVTDC